jgi:hypothetical protein
LNGWLAGGKMNLPDWALRALDHFKPQSPYRGDGPDPGRLRQWAVLCGRFEARWQELAPDQWKVPVDHPAYAGLRRGYRFEPADYVRQCILETAIECAWESGANKRPAEVIEAVKELDRLNEKISELAENLASLFRQRDNIRLDFSLRDQSRDEETAAPDPFNLAGVLELTFKKHHFRTSSYCYQDGLGVLYDALSSSNGDAPTIADVLDEISWRMPRAVTSFDAGDLAVIGSKTNRSEWSPWALRLVARLNDWAGNGLPDGFFLECLTHDQLATLAMVSVDAPSDAYNAPQMRELIKRFKARSSQ